MSVANNIPRVLPGEPLSLVVNLSQYGLALNSAQVTATVTNSPGQSQVYNFTRRQGSNSFVLSIPAPLNGIYSCRIIASGTSMAGKRFTRDATRTFAAGRPIKPLQPATTASGDLCELLHCLLKTRSIQEFLSSNGIDKRILRKCLASACKGDDIPSHMNDDKPCGKNQTR